MSFAHPWALLVAAGAAAAVVALHFLARRRPRAAPLPTARFIPTRSVRAPARSARPSDLLLLLLRVLVVLLAGAAFAGPVLHPELRPLARVVVLDLSGSAGSSAAGRDSAMHYLREGDLLMVFDSAARQIGGDPRDSLATLRGAAVPGSLGAALVAATRAASVLRGRADSVELVLISPFAAEEWDAATGRIRSLWRGRALLVPMEMARGAEHGGAVDVRSEADDPVRVAAALMNGDASPGNVRIVRGVASDADTLWARSPGHVLVRWPVNAPDDWPRRDRPDTVGAVAAGDAVLVASFARDAMPPAAGRVVARWVDGVVAATERDNGEGCLRDVAIQFPAKGDLALGESARRLVRAISAPCGGIRALVPLPESTLALLRGAGDQPAARILGRPEGEGEGEGRTATFWLLLAAALLLVAELLLRRAPVAADMEGAP